MNIKETGYAPGVPVFRNDPTLQALPGGFTLDVSAFPDGAEVPAGTAITVDETARTAVPVRTAVLARACAATDGQIEVEKGHFVAVGDRIGGKKVDSIDRTDALRDLLVLSAAIGRAMPAGAKLGTGDGNALTLHAVRAAKGDAQAVDAIVGGTVYERRIGYVSEQTRKNLPNVIFTQSR